MKMPIRLPIVLLPIVAMLFYPTAVFPMGLAPLPPVPHPVKNPATPEKAELGRKLFFDRRLSGDGTMTCATCHDPEAAFSDKLPVSHGYLTTANWRNAPSLVNVAYRKRLFWDGRTRSLEDQALSPMTSPFEMNQNLFYLEEELKEIPHYVEAFQKVFGSEISRAKIAFALAAFQRTIVSDNTPLDRFLRGDAEALTPTQKTGYELFVGKAGCVACHNGPLLTDEAYYNLGVPENPKTVNSPRIAATRRFFARMAGYDEYRNLKEDPGRYLFTLDMKDWKAFVTPPLREIALTGPYMHNGVFQTLDEVIDFFDRGGGDDPGKSSLLKTLQLSSEEKSALKAFLAEGLRGEIRWSRPEKKE